MAPSVFQYLDYRKYLRDSIAAKRSKSRGFSLEALGRRTGCLTKSHLSLIIAGRWSLTKERAEALGRAIGLSGAEMRYYHHLVQFNQAKGDAERDLHLSAMMSEVQRRAGPNLPLDSYRILASWKCLAIRELARLPDFDPTPQTVSSRLKNLVSPLEAKKAVRALVAAGLLTQSGSGQLVPSDETLRTTDEIGSLAVRKYHKSCLELAKRILDAEPVGEREFGSVNLLLRSRDKPKLKELIKSFREQILSLAAAGDVTGAQVTQVNVQMF